MKCGDPCAWPDGCDVNDELYRVNPKGEPGVFMCREHARAVEREAIDSNRRRGR